MIWQNARWRWPLLTVGIVAGCLLAFSAPPGTASSSAGPGDQARLAVSNSAGGSVQVTLPEAEAGSALRQVRWLYGAAAASAILLVAAIQYRAYRRLHERRGTATAALRPGRESRPHNPAGGRTEPWPALDPENAREPAWTPGLGLHPGIGD